MNSDKITWPLETVTPESVGMDPKRCVRVDEMLRSYVDGQRHAGIQWLIARHGKIAWKGRYGHRDIERDLPMEEDTLFHIYSMTKPICAVAVLMLYEEGHFTLNDPISNYFPEFREMQVKQGDELVPARREITIHDLLVHLGGLSYEVALHTCDLTREQFIQELSSLPLLSQPGEQWNYSASNDLLGALIEVVSGQALDVFLQQRIFDPLEMSETRFVLPENQRARVATIYRRSEGGGLEPSVPLGGRDFYKQPSFCSAGGGLVSTTSDYLRFAQMLLNQGEFQGERLLSPKSVELMASNHLPKDHPPLDISGDVYGLSVAVLRDLREARRVGSIGEFGWGGAACTQVWIDPQEDMIALIMLQHFGESQECDVMIKFRNMSCQTIVSK